MDEKQKEGLVSLAENITTNIRIDCYFTALEFVLSLCMDLAKYLEEGGESKDRG